jgi:hypothetical protein
VNVGHVWAGAPSGLARSRSASRSAAGQSPGRGRRPRGRKRDWRRQPASPTIACTLTGCRTYNPNIRVIRGHRQQCSRGARRRGDEPSFCALIAGVRVSRSVVNSVHTEPRRNSEKGNSFLGELRPRADSRCQQRTPSAARTFPMPSRTSPRLRVPARTLFDGVATTAAAASVHTDHKRWHA